MRSSRRGRAVLYVVGLAVLAAVALVLGAGPVEAKKPSEPPPEPEPESGGIYFAYDGAWYVLASDGSSSSTLDVGGIPSRELHAGERWFLRLEKTDTGSYPDGNPHRQLFVRNEAAGMEVMLFDTSVEFARDVALLDWAPGDDAVTYVAFKWGLDPATGDDVIVEAGIYALPIAYDEDGNVDGPDGDPVLVVASSTTVLENGVIIVDAELGFAWSPDGSSLVYGCWGGTSGNEIRITDVAYPDDSVVLARGNLFRFPDWSVNDEITYSTGLTIQIVNSDGSDARSLLGAPSRTTVIDPHFSADGKSVVYKVVDAASNPPAPAVTHVYKTSVSKPRGKSLGALINYGSPLTWR